MEIHGAMRIDADPDVVPDLRRDFPKAGIRIGEFEETAAYAPEVVFDGDVMLLTGFQDHAAGVLGFLRPLRQTPYEDVGMGEITVDTAFDRGECIRSVITKQVLLVFIGSEISRVMFVFVEVVPQDDQLEVVLPYRILQPLHAVREVLAFQSDFDRDLVLVLFLELTQTIDIVG